MTTTLVLTGDLVLAAADTSTSSDLAMWSGIASFATPILVAVINRPGWKPAARLLVTVLVSIVMGAATAATQGTLTGTRWTTSALLILAGAVVWYQTAFKTIAPTVEAATSPGRHRAPE